MSAPGESAASAKDTKAQAADWLERRDREDWGAADQAALEAWLDESMAHSTAFWRMEAAWARTERLGALREPMRLSQARALPRVPKATRIVAALGLFAVLGVFGAGLVLAPRGKTYSTPVGGHEIVTLGDGSSIELNTDTSLRVALNGNARTVTLEKGEAYFQVVHDAAHPFVVNAAGHRVTDIGTKFLMRKDASRVEVALYEGEASFESLTQGARTQRAVLSPGDVAIARPDRPGFRVVRNEPAQALVNKLAWQRGFLVMNHTTLAEAARDLNRYNRQKIVIADEAAARMEMYGTIPLNGVAGFVRVAQGVLGLRVAKHGDEIVISK